MDCTLLAASADAAQQELHEQLGDGAAHIRFMAELLTAAPLRETARRSDS